MPSCLVLRSSFAVGSVSLNDAVSLLESPDTAATSTGRALYTLVEYFFSSHLALVNVMQVVCATNNLSLTIMPCRCSCSILPPPLSPPLHFTPSTTRNNTKVVGRAGVLAEPLRHLVSQPSAVGDAPHVQARVGVGHPSREAAVWLLGQPGPRYFGVRCCPRAQQVRVRKGWFDPREAWVVQPMFRGGVARKAIWVGEG